MGLSWLPVSGHFMAQASPMGISWSTLAIQRAANHTRNDHPGKHHWRWSRRPELLTNEPPGDKKPLLSSRLPPPEGPDAFAPFGPFPCAPISVGSIPFTCRQRKKIPPAPGVSRSPDVPGMRRPGRRRA